MTTPTPKPILKINISRQNSIAAASPANVAQTPSSEAPRIKLKIPGSTPATPAEAPGVQRPVPPAPPPPSPPQTTKSGRPRKESAKLKEAKKRAAEDLDSDEENEPSGGKEGPVKAKKIKLLATPSLKTPTINLRTAKGRVPEHPPGDGYDSEASDRELDPTIEEQFILRLLPGEDCDYLRRMIEERKIGLPRDKGGADVSLKFIDDEGRRAVINIRGNLYAAALLDLPTITESMKTWDRKAFMKTADICQMLMVLARVRTEAEAKSIPLPKQVDNGYRWPHGLTPPMHDCVHRRFRKTVSRREIENKEAEVERLLAEDEDAEDTRWEWVDDRKAAAGRARTDVSASVAAAGRAGYDQDADAEAEEDDTHDYFGAAVANGYRQKLDVGEADAEGEEYGEADLTADLEADLEAEFEAEMNSPTAGGVVESAEATDTATTPALFDEEEEEDEDEDEEEDSDIDEDEQARLDELKGVREDIEELKKQIASKEDEYARQANAILRKRLEESIKKLKSELQLKMSSIGEVDDD